VGSESSTGADSDFLYNLMKLLSNKLNFELETALVNSFLLSADNAHALHPNHPEFYDKVDAPRMNKGIVIKFNASNRYTSDGLSSSLFIEMLNKKNLPYQYFTNRSDIRGGSTLGNILLSHVSILSVDVGLAQLAMHSSYETAGVKDIELAIQSFETFYQSEIIKDKDQYLIK
jgi:aspartyl aminopeptidase